MSQTPYLNLILTGYMGVGKVSVGRTIAKKVDVPFIDLETEIQMREGITAEEIRQLFGEQRLRTLEDDICQELSLRRSSVLSVGGPTLLDVKHRERLISSGIVLVLTCSLNEILRRLYANQGARFHDPKVRSAALNQIRREQQIHQIPGLPTLDTTRLNADEVAEKAIAFWHENDVVTL